MYFLGWMVLLVEEECYVSLIGIRIWNYDISLLASRTRLPCAMKTIKSYEVFFSKGWVAMVRARTHTCNKLSNVCVENLFWTVCVMCLSAARFRECDLRSHFCALLLKMPLFALTLFQPDLVMWRSCKGWFRPWPVGIGLKAILEGSILIKNILSCFRMSFPVLINPFLF